MSFFDEAKELIFSPLGAAVASGALAVYLASQDRETQLAVIAHDSSTIADKFTVDVLNFKTYADPDSPETCRKSFDLNLRYSVDDVIAIDAVGEPSHIASYITTNMVSGTISGWLMEPGTVSITIAFTLADGSKAVYVLSINSGGAYYNDKQLRVGNTLYEEVENRIYMYDGWHFKTVMMAVSALGGGYVAANNTFNFQSEFQTLVSGMWWRGFETVHIAGGGNFPGEMGTAEVQYKWIDGSSVILHDVTFKYNNWMHGTHTLSRSYPHPYGSSTHFEFAKIA